MLDAALDLWFMLSCESQTRSTMAAEDRYENMQYRRAGRSGLALPSLSLGFWHNLGRLSSPVIARRIATRAFDLGINCFDLANNYGPPPGSAEEHFGRILRSDLAPFRDELVITTKAGFEMWSGPYGDGGSRKYLLASLDQSLKRLGLEYVDIFYHHRADPSTPLEETMGALDHAVRSGKALYVGISNYDEGRTEDALQILRDLGTPCLVHQPRYNMLDRRLEHGLLGVLDREGLGCAVYSPLAQGILTPRYLDSIPDDSRAANPEGFLTIDQVQRRQSVVRRLAGVAERRGQSLAQMAVRWTLRYPQVTSAIVGVSSVEQLESNVAALDGPDLSHDELQEIEQILNDES